MTNESVERRSARFQPQNLSTRADSTRKPKLAGIAAVFDSPSADLGGFVEIIKPGAFRRAVQEDDVRALWNHNPDYVLGRSKNGTLTLSEDAKGLYFEVELPETSYASDLMASITRGDVDQMSFGFLVRDGGENWEKDGNGKNIRILTDLQLFDVSPVTFPAYPDSTVAVRSLERNRQSQQQNPKTCLNLWRMRLKLLELG